MKRQLESLVYRLARRLLGPGAVLNQSTWAGYTRDALVLAKVIDCAPGHLSEVQQHLERVTAPLQERVCNWYLPQFDNPFYGGVMTILRLADHLYRRHGLRQRILICGAASKDEVRVNLTKAFPALADAEVIVLDSVSAIQSIPFAEYSIATLWTTAYVLLGVRNTGFKYYMIQDYEPAFYPAGSTYAQAELTYRFGFYGIANTVSLKNIYERDYAGTAVVLRPTIDKTVFYPATTEKQATPKRLFYYARPGTPRNGFELAAAALKLLKDQLGEQVDIICAGAGWNPDEYGLDGVVRSVGLLPYAATGDLYRSCHVGFVMMMTKHPSYLPFELMACGAIVVTNHNEANTWLLKDGDNCLLSPPSGACLARTLAYALNHYDELAPLRERATHLIHHETGDWETHLHSVAEFLISPPAQTEAYTPYANRFIALTSDSPSP